MHASNGLIDRCAALRGGCFRRARRGARGDHVGGSAASQRGLVCRVERGLGFGCCWPGEACAWCPKRRTARPEQRRSFHSPLRCRRPWSEFPPRRDKTPAAGLRLELWSFFSHFLFVRSQCAALCDGSQISKMRIMESRGSIPETSAHAQPSSTSSACSLADNSGLQHESPFHASSSIFAASIFAAGPRLGRWASAMGEEVEVLLFDVVDFASRRCFGASVTRSRAVSLWALS